MRSCSLIRVFVVRKKKICILGYPKDSDQADLNLHLAQISFSDVVAHMWNIRGYNMRYYELDYDADLMLVSYLHIITTIMHYNKILNKSSNTFIHFSINTSMKKKKIQANLNSSNTYGSFTTNSFLSSNEILPIAQENKYLRKFSYFNMKLYTVCTHLNSLIEVILMSTLSIPLLWRFP